MDQVTNKPFPNALNIVLSEKLQGSEDITTRFENTIICNHLDEAVQILSQESNLDEVSWINKC